jgi:hypothetical protein
MREKPTDAPIIIQVINFGWYLLNVSALHCHLQGAFLVPSSFSRMYLQNARFKKQNPSKKPRQAALRGVI